MNLTTKILVGLMVAGLFMFTACGSKDTGSSDATLPTQINVK